MVRIILILTFLVASLSTSVRADSINIPDFIKNIPIKEGVTYDIKNDRFLNTVGIGVINYGHVGLNADYIGIDGIGATLAYDLKGLPIENVPVAKYLQYLEVGYTVGYRTLALNPSTDNPKSDNQFIQGPTVFAKIKF